MQSNGSSNICLIVGVGLAVCLAVGAPFAIAVIAGSGFDASIPVLRLQSLTMITAFLLATWSFAMLSLGLFRQILIANAVAGVVAVVGTLTLAPPLGAEGAAGATVAAEAVLVALLLTFLIRARPALTPALSVVPKVAAAAALAVGVVLAAHQLPSVALSALAGLVFAAVVLATRAVPPELFGAIPFRQGKTPKGEQHPSDS